MINNFFKKISTFIFLFVLFFGPSIGARYVFGAELGGLDNTASGVGYANMDKANAGTAIAEKIGTIISTILGLIGMIFLTLIFMGSFDITSAGGNEETVKKGRLRIKTGAIGVLIIFSAFLISKLFLGFFANATFLANVPNPAP